MTIEQLKHENTVLKNRCAVLSKGFLCCFCKLECENRKAPFDENYVPEEEEDIGEPM